MAEEIEERIIEKIRQRRDVGLKKYGVSMKRTDLTALEWLDHAQNESLNRAIYLEKLKDILQKILGGTKKCAGCGQETNAACSDHINRSDGMADTCYARVTYSITGKQIWEKGCGYRKASAFDKAFARKIIGDR